jgi:hypothetical protein
LVCEGYRTRNKEALIQEDNPLECSEEKQMVYKSLLLKVSN